MGCTPIGKMMSKAVKRHRAGKMKRERTLNVQYPNSEEKIVKPESLGNSHPIYITHPTAEVTSTWAPPVPDTPISPSTHRFPETSETKEVIQVRFAEPDTFDRIRVHDGVNQNDIEYIGHESDMVSYSYNYNSSVTGQAYEESGKRECYYGQYQYYPTPVREGIYNLTTDGNRLTTIFSDENPNACNIV